jgi:hypothetical protein
MRRKIARPEHVPGAIESLISTLSLDKHGHIPDSIRGSMLAIPCKRMLRAVYGSAWRAIIAWAWLEIQHDVFDRVYAIRCRIYMTAAEREVEEVFGREE